MLNFIEIVLVVIVAYYVLGWITLLLVQLLHKVEIVLTCNDRLRVREKNKPAIFWAWPIMLPIALGLWLLYIPYLALIKLTFKGS